MLQVWMFFVICYPRVVIASNDSAFPSSQEIVLSRNLPSAQMETSSLVGKGFWTWMRNDKFLFSLLDFHLMGSKTPASRQ